MKLAFTKKFLKQVSKLNDALLAKEIEAIIESAEKATGLSEIKILKIKRPCRLLPNKNW